MWGNLFHGDCVTAEEAFAKACVSPEIFIPEGGAIDWASRHGALEGIPIIDVLNWMQTDGFQTGLHIYDDGPYYSVDWTNSATLHSAIFQGPIKLGVAGAQIEVAFRQFQEADTWFGIGFLPDSGEDHCVSLCGYGTIDWLAQQLGVTLPHGVRGNQHGYAMFTWDTIGIVDVPSLIAVTHEAWLRQPTTVRRPTNIPPPSPTNQN